MIAHGIKWGGQAPCPLFDCLNLAAHISQITSATEVLYTSFEIPDI